MSVILYDSPTGLITATLPNPLFGYEVEVRLAITVARFGATWYAFDNGAAYDRRTFRGTLHLTTTQMDDLSALLLRDSDSGRALYKVMHLSGDVTSEGFMPFGPDLGDQGTTWQVDTPAFEYAGQRALGGGRFVHEGKLTMTMRQAATGYSLPTQRAEGPFALAGVTGLRYPDFAPSPSYAIVCAQATSGVAYQVDSGTAGNLQEAEITLTNNTSKAAALLDALVDSVTGRITGMPMVVSSSVDICPWGVDSGRQGTSTVQLTDGVITTRHINPDQWETRLRVSRSA